jgi:hypothetical protein
MRLNVVGNPDMRGAAALFIDLSCSGQVNISELPANIVLVQ